MQVKKQQLEQDMKQWTDSKYIYMMKYYSVIKKNEIMSFAATWVDLEIILSLESKSERQANTV